MAGDSRIYVAVTQFLRREWKFESRQVKAKPYWNPEKTGLE
jgi:NADPH-dependent ferric siderophore reductase